MNKFTKLAQKHELANAAGAGFHLPESEMQTIIDALRIAAQTNDEPHQDRARAEIAAAVAAERNRCAQIADEFVERTNADIAHAIANAIRSTK